jgi:pyridoxal biosynthesis lyase PdxS
MTDGCVGARIIDMHEEATLTVKAGLAEMLKGGVIMGCGHR